MDDPTLQAVKQTDVEAMKAEGIAAEEIIDRLLTGSESFRRKTQFSQEKYLKKKRTK